MLSFPGAVWDCTAPTEDRARCRPEWAGTQRTGGRALNP